MRPSRAPQTGRLSFRCRLVLYPAISLLNIRVSRIGLTLWRAAKPKRGTPVSTLEGNEVARTQAEAITGSFGNDDPLPRAVRPTPAARAALDLEEAVLRAEIMRCHRALCETAQAHPNSDSRVFRSGRGYRLETRSS